MIAAIGLAAVGGLIRFDVDWERHAYGAGEWLNTLFGLLFFGGIVGWIALSLMSSLNQSIVALEALTRELEDASERLRTALERQHVLFNDAAARDQAEAANCAKSRFLAAVSHEMRMPLHGIPGAISVLDKDGAAPRRDRATAGALETIRASGRRLLAMIEDLIDIARLETHEDFGLQTESPAPDADPKHRVRLWISI